MGSKNMNAENKNRQAVTASCGVEGLSHLKTFYSIPHFRIGGTYDLDDPSSWESGGTGGVTLESLGEGPLRTACIAVGTPHRDADGLHRQRRPLQPLLLRGCGPDVLLLVPWPGGKRLLRRPCRGPRGADRHGSNTTSSSSMPSVSGAQANRATASASSSRNTASWTASRPTTGCCGIT